LKSPNTVRTFEVDLELKVDLKASDEDKNLFKSFNEKDFI